MDFAGPSASQRALDTQERAVFPTAQSGKALIFVDAGVGDRLSWSSLAPGSEVHLLSRDRNAFDQVTDVLQGRSGIDSLQILSHGASGGLALGADWLTLENLGQHSTQIQSWGQAMSQGGDILLYGCSVAQGMRGRAFLEGLSALTGADIAASVDQTGDGNGGNWTLEASIGSVNLQNAPSFHYSGLLDLDLISKPYEISATAGGSMAPRQSVSQDGNFVVFTSTAGNLVSNDRNGTADVFLLDRTTDTITLVSQGTTGSAANGASSDAVISADGKSVAFLSAATDLAAGDTNTTQDVYLWDRATGTTQLITPSVDVNSTHGASGELAISDDASVVAFSSEASDLIAEDAVLGAIDSNGRKDVFFWKRGSATPVNLVSRGRNGVTASGASSAPTISGDGTQIAFLSRAKDFGNGNTDTDTNDDVYLYDANLGLPLRLSQKADGSDGSSSSANPVISRDGKRVAFTSLATNLTGQTDGNSSQDLFVWTRSGAPLAGTLQLVTVAANGTKTGEAVVGQPSGADSGFASLSDDGNLIAFTSLATDLVTGDTNSQRDIFLRNLTTQQTILVSKTAAGVPGTGDSLTSSISGDGQTIAFTSTAKNLNAGANDGVTNAFLVKNGVISLLSRPNGGLVGGNRPTDRVLVSNDGSAVVLQSDAANLVDRDSNGGKDIFVTTTATGAIALVSRIGPALASTTANGASTLLPKGSVSDNGDFVVFASSASDLVPGDSNGVSDIFLRSVQGETTTRISVPNSRPETVAPSINPLISGNGRYVVFDSVDANLTGLTDSNGQSDVFLWNSGTNGLVQVSAKGTTVGNGASTVQAISADGRYVVFASSASNLVTGDGNGAQDIFIWDRDDTTNDPIRLVSKTAANASGAGISSNAVISADGKYVAFESQATDLVAGDTNGVSDIFLYDVTTGQVTLLSRVGAAGAIGNGASTNATISSGVNPRVAFLSDAKNLSALDTNNTRDVYVRDITTNSTTLVTVNANGSAAGNAGGLGAPAGAESPVISRDGKFVAFVSTANDLTATDGNNGADVFIRGLETGGTTSFVSAKSGSTNNSAAGVSAAPAISGDGRYVLFTSTAVDLAGADNNNAQDVFLRDTRLNTTALLSRQPGVGAAVASATGASQTPVLSNNGSYAVFNTDAIDAIASDFNGAADVVGRSLKPLVAIKSVVAIAQEGTTPVVGTYEVSRNDTVGVLDVQLALFATTNPAARADYTLTASGGATITITPTGYTLRLPDGIQKVTVSLTPVDDLAAEAAETVQLDLVDDTAYSFATATGTATVTIAANDTVVTTNNDSGEGSLRQAILNANAFAGPDVISFKITTGTGLQTIRLQTALPEVTGPIILDGTTQTGFTPATPLIAIDGSLVTTAAVNGLTLQGNDNLIKGVIVQGFTGSGISIEGSNNRIGDATNANRILNNKGAGVAVVSGTGNAISSNTIQGNLGLAIDLGPIGQTPNDPLDADTGANDLQNFPVLTFAEPTAADATIRGTLNAAASKTYRVEFFSNPTVAATGLGEGQYIGTVDVTTDAQGAATINFTALGLTTGYISATVTDTATKSTSEFAPARAIKPPFPTATLTGPTAAILEGAGAGTATFTVTLDKAYTEIVTVDYTTVDGTATFADRDYQAKTGTLSFAIGETQKTITIGINGDNRIEDDETFSVKLQNPQKLILPATTTASVTLTNDDFPTVSLYGDTASQLEGDQGKVAYGFTIILSEASTKPVTVTYQTVTGTADATDFEAVVTPVTVTFAPGETQKAIVVNALGDLTAEGDETFSVKLASPVNAILGQALVGATILDDDTQPTPVIFVSKNGGVLTEGNTGTVAQTFTISLSNASKQPVTVSYKTVDDTALAGSDYVAVPATVLTFAPGETLKTVTVQVNGDLLPEAAETFALVLENPTGGTIGSPRTIATITDDDTPPELSVSATPGSQAEGNSGNKPYTFTVNLSRAATVPVTVNYATGGGTATAATDYIAATGTLTFAAGETSKTVVVNALGDTQVEPDETFGLVLSGPSGATLSPTAATATVIIANDDVVITPPPPPAPVVPAISVAANAVAILEGNSGTQPYSFTVSLSQATTRAVTVNYQTGDGTATVADGDYATTNGSLTFAPGETSKTVTVAVTGDQKVESNETFFFGVSSADPAIATVATAVATATITNDDVVVVVPPPIPPVPPIPPIPPIPPLPPVLPAKAVGVDGDADILWRNTRTQEVGLWQLNQTPNIDRKTILSVPSGWQVVGSGDFDRDGDSDLLWKNNLTSETAIWTMEGNQLVKGQMLPTLGDLAWDVAAVADFNGDAQSDVLWRNGRTGQVALWFMNNGTLLNGVYLPSAVDLNWQIRGVGDFNGDGQTDILWHNESSGNVGFWLLNQGQFVSVATALPVVNDRNWQIAGVGDLNGDGQTDILWNNRATSEVGFWKMQGTNYQSATTIGNTLDRNWRVEALKDFNSDGYLDLVLRNSVSGENALWYLVGGNLGAKVTLPSTPASAEFEAVGDFNRDGKPDIVWRDRLSGETYLWNTDASLLGRALTLPNLPNRNWQVGLTADFDRDGDADILLYSRQTGESTIWLTENGQYVGSAALPTLPTPDWKPVAAADFDRDGDQDLLWYNSRTGDVGFWQMQGTQYQRAVLLPTIADLNWQIAGVGDFDRDGNLDIVWRNQVNDDTGAWKMNGFQFTGGVINLPKTDANWRLERVADLDGDRDSDLLWRNGVTGEVALWRMNGNAIERAYYLPTVPDRNWQIRGARDFNGDGYSDLLWQNTATGSNVIWYLKDTGFGAAVYLPTTPDSWTIAGVDDFQTS